MKKNVPELKILFSVQLLNEWIILNSLTLSSKLISFYPPYIGGKIPPPFLQSPCIGGKIPPPSLQSPCIGEKIEISHMKMKIAGYKTI